MYAIIKQSGGASFTDTIIGMFPDKWDADMHLGMYTKDDRYYIKEFSINAHIECAINNALNKEVNN